MFPWRYEKRQKEIITENGLYWPEKVIILLGWRSVGKRMDGNRYSGDIFHFNIVTLVPLYLHIQLASEGKIKVPRMSACFPSSGTKLCKCSDLTLLSSESTLHLCVGLRCYRKWIVHSFPFQFPSGKKRFKCCFKWKQLSNCLFCRFSYIPQSHKNQPSMPVPFLLSSLKCIFLIHWWLTWNMAHVSLHHLQVMLMVRWALHGASKATIISSESFSGFSPSHIFLHMISALLSNQLNLFALVLPWIIPLDHKFPRDPSPLTYKILLSLQHTNQILFLRSPCPNSPKTTVFQSPRLCTNLSESDLRSILSFIHLFIFVIFVEDFLKMATVFLVLIALPKPCPSSTRGGAFVPSPWTWVASAGAALSNGEWRWQWMTSGDGE